MLHKKYYNKYLIILHQSFYKDTFMYIMFVFTMLFLRIIQIEYKIQGFSFIFCAILFFLGVLLFYLYCRILNTALKKALFTILMLLVILSVIIILNGGGLSLFKNLTVNYITVKTSFFYSHFTYFPQYILFFSIVIPIFVAIILYLNSKKLGDIIIILTIVYISILWYSTGLLEVKVYILLYIVLSLLIYSYTTYNRSLKKYEKMSIKISIDNKKIINYLFIISVLIGVLTYIVSEAFGVKSISERIEDYKMRNKNILEASKNNRFDLLSSGYENNDKKLGGPINLNYSEVLKVNSDKTYYLKGLTKDYYNGFSWSKTDNNYEKFLYDASNKSSVNISKFILENKLKSIDKTIEIYPTGLRCSTIFVPNFAYKVQLSSGEAGYNAAKDFMLLGGDLLIKPYKVSFYNDLDDERLIKDGKVTFNYNNDITTSYKQYLQIPDNLSPDIYKIVYEITKGCNTTLDKVNKIEAYLSNTYKYSLDVSEVPENKEFIDYFLFTEKKGYCTYFASASTMFCRIAGIPARYVEGFKMGEEKDSDGNYVVTNDMAHAWTEVLVDSGKDIWSIIDAVPNAQRQQVIGENKSVKKTGVYYWSDKKDLSITDKSIKNSYSAYKMKDFNIYWIICLVFTTLVLITFIKIILGIKIRNKILSSSSYVPLYYYIKHRIRSTHKEIIIPEDDYKWIESIEDKDLKQNIEYLINCLYEEFYGRKKIKGIKNIEVYLTLEKYLIKKQSRLIYYLNKLYSLITYSEKYIK